jgi:fumarate reductase flavoprotein subunit
MSDQAQHLNRRGFLRLAGMATVAGATAAAVGGCAPQETSEVQLPGGAINFTRETDVLVVGSGMSGLWASYRLAKAGVNTLVVDKQPSWGGDAVLACGVIYGRGTVVQEQYGIPDASPEEAFEQVAERYAESRAPELHRMSYVNAAEAIRIWTEEFGIAWMDMTTPGWTPFFHVHEDGLHNVQKLMQPLQDYAEENGVEFIYQMRATSLIMDGDAVVGMRVKDEVSGAYEDIKAKKVVLATGDYVSNQEMLSQYGSPAVKVPCHTPNSMGEGHLMAVAAGAELMKMGQIVAQGPDFVPTTTVGLFDSTLNVFPDGRRIGNEMSYMEPCLMYPAEGFHCFWTIYDEEIRNGPHASTYEERINMGGVIEAESVEELAAKTLIPLEQLQATLDKFNEDAETGVDTEFNKPIGIKPLAAPFYAVSSHSVRYKAAGGAAVDANLQVLNRADEPIPNLYAIGGAQGELSINIHQAAAMGLHVGEVLEGALAE